MLLWQVDASHRWEHCGMFATGPRRQGKILSEPAAVVARSIQTTALPGKNCKRLRQVTCIVRERQLRLYGYVARALRRIPPIEFFLVEIRGGAHRLHVCVRWRPIWRIRAWRAWRLPWRWPDGGRGTTVARLTRRRIAPAYVPIPDLIWYSQTST